MRVEYLPSVVTSANLVAGFLSLIYTINENYQIGALFILVAAVLDSLDGKLARFLGTSSEFGKQLDSLADLVSFGVAPAVLAYSWQLEGLGTAGLVAAAFFTLCGALRLARFNILKITDHFLGIPITMAGALVAIFVLLAGALSPYVSVLFVIALSIFMISSIKIPKF